MFQSRSPDTVDSNGWTGNAAFGPIRRLLLITLFAAFAGLCVSCAQAQDKKSPSRSYTFYAIGDPQINVPKFGTEGTEKTIEMMNTLPGTDWPFGGNVQPPRGVLLAGDFVDAMGNRDNWKRYKSFFDPRGNALLKFPVFAGTGNHDLTSEVTGGKLNWIEKEHVRRNRQRPADLHFGPNGFHYSWDWGNVHFVNLNLFPGNKHRPVYGRKAPWNDPKNSLDFLKEDLARNVGDSNRPVFLMWHYGLEGWGFDKWWTEKDLKNLARVVDGYNIVLILHGHEHAYKKYSWNGYDVVMAPSPQYDHENKRSKPKGFLVFQVRDGELQMAVRRPDGWGRTWKKALVP